MKKALLLFLLASGLANAQSLQLQGGTGVPGSGYTNTIRNGAGAPAFLIGNNGDFYIDTVANVIYGPKAAGVWPSSGISLGGAASVWGSITGLLLNQADLQSALDAKQNVGAYLTALTGDLSASGPGSAAATLATVNSGPGACGDSTHVCAVTTNAKGLVTAQTATAITAGGLNQLTGDVMAGPGTGSQPATLATVNAGPGACGDASHVCQVTTNAKGLVTSQSAVTVSQAPGLTSNSALTATYNATTSDSFVDCNGTVNLPASPITDETITVYNVGSSSCTVSAGSNFMDNGTGTGNSRSLSSHSTIRLHWDSVNTRWRFDQGFLLAFDALTSPTADFTLTTSHAISFITGLGGSIVFGGGVNKPLNVAFQNGGADDGTNDKVVQWLDSSGSLLGYVDGSGNASFTSLSGSLAASWLTGTLAAARMPAYTGDVTTSAGGVATTLATVNSTTGVCGDASHVCQHTTNGKGLVTSQSAVSIAIAAGAVSGLAASATTDATNASNISSGTLPAARLPNPTAIALGGVESIVVTSHQWNDSISTSGVPHQSQPAFADISGSATAAQLPATTSKLTGQTATLGTTAVLTAGASGGIYLFSAEIWQDSAVTCTGYGTVLATIAYQQANLNSSVATTTYTFAATAAAAEATSALAVRYIKPSGTITYTTTYSAGTGCGGSGSTYTVVVTAIQIG